MDKSQLDEILAWQKEKIIADLKAKGPIPQRKYSKAEVGKALKEFRESAKRRQQSTHNKLIF